MGLGQLNGRSTAFSSLRSNACSVTGVFAQIFVVPVACTQAKGRFAGTFATYVSSHKAFFLRTRPGFSAQATRTVQDYDERWQDGPTINDPCRGSHWSQLLTFKCHLAPSTTKRYGRRSQVKSMSQSSQMLRWLSRRRLFAPCFPSSLFFSSFFPTSLQPNTSFCTNPQPSFSQPLLFCLLDRLSSLLFSLWTYSPPLYIYRTLHPKQLTAHSQDGLHRLNAAFTYEPFNIFTLLQPQQRHNVHTEQHLHLSPL